MTRYEKITRVNAMDIIRRFAKEYRKTLGKARAEIIIVGGGSKNVTERSLFLEKIFAGRDRDGHRRKKLPETLRYLHTLASASNALYLRTWIFTPF